MLRNQCPTIIVVKEINLLVIGEDENGDEVMRMRTKMMTTLFIMSEKLTVHSS